MITFFQGFTVLDEIPDLVYCSIVRNITLYSHNKMKFTA